MRNNNLADVTFEHCTEACPKMTRRLRTGIAAELLAWLIMLRDRYKRQLDALPKPSDRAMGLWDKKQRDYLVGQINLISHMAGNVTDKFATVEWNLAVVKAQHLMNGLREDGTPHPADASADDDAGEGAGDGS